MKKNCFQKVTFCPIARLTYMNLIKSSLLLLLMSLTQEANSQFFMGAMTFEEVEGEKCGPYSIGISTYVIPDPDSILHYKIKKSTEIIQINSGGTIHSGTVVSTYNRRGYIVSSKEVDDDFPRKRTFETIYHYNPSYTSVVIQSRANDSITQLDSVLFDAYNKPTRRTDILRHSVSTYSYLGNSNKLTSVISTDSAGRFWSKVVQYNPEGKMLSCIELAKDQEGKIDTLYAALLERDANNRIVAHRLYSKYEFEYNVNNPDSIYFPRLADIYEYNESGQITKHISGYSSYHHPLTYKYSYNGEGKLEKESIQLNDSTWTEHVHHYTHNIDTVLVFTTYANFFGRGPATILGERHVFQFDSSGRWISRSRYSLTPGLQGLVADETRKYDEQGRLVETKMNSYDYKLKAMKPWSGMNCSFYKNGLLKSHVYLRENNLLNTGSDKKFKYYLWGCRE